MPLATPQRTAERRRVEPIPMMLDVMTCVVQGNFVFVGLGALIGVALYFNRGRLQ